MENNPLLDISRISGRRGSKSTGRFLTRIKQMIQLKGKVRGGAMQDILSERHLKISTFRRRKPGVQPFWQLPSSQTLQDKWLPSFSQNVDCFFLHIKCILGMRSILFYPLVPASIKSDTSFLQILFITSKFYLYFSLLVLGEFLYHTQNLQKLQ